jgi:glycosyltransferase involved in cell wall biosynthesis
MNERKNILWLVGWYPNKYDPFDGDFIQRHVKAASLRHQVHVLFIKQETEQKEIEREGSASQTSGYSEQIVYLPKRKGLFGKWKDYREWKRIFGAEAMRIIRQNKPNLVHVHIPWKVGLIALWTCRRFKLPYVVSEHWGIYNRVVDDNIYKRPFFVRYLLKRIYRKAIAFVSVSRFLGEAVNQMLVKKEFTVIPNVVDTGLFHLGDEKRSHFTFLHVSNMVPLKNVEDILTAFKNFLQQSDANAQLVMVGNKDNRYPLLAREMGLLDISVFFKGEVSYVDVASEMRRSHVLVLASNIENSPCVIGEALCCGVPVIATAVGGIPEMINEKNGLLVPPQNVNALTKAMSNVYLNYGSYDTSAIASAAEEKFSETAVGAAFSALYSNLQPET